MSRANIADSSASSTDCQVALSLSIANEKASLPIAWRLYLPERWAYDPEPQTKVKIPANIGFQTKPRFALDQVRAAVPRARRQARFWPTPAMVPTARSARISPSLASTWSSACSQP